MNKMTQNIRGAGGGGGKGGGGSRQAIEDKTTLRSKQYATVVDVISEGEIVGLVNGLKSVYLGDTRLQNDNGTFNFNGVSSFESTGAATLPMVDGKEGYFRSGGVKATSQIGTEITYTTSVTRSVTNPEVDWVEVTIGVPQLTTQNKDNGDMHGGAVSLRIDVQSNGGGFYPQMISDRWGSEVTNVDAVTSRSTSSTTTGMSMFLKMFFTAVYGDRAYNYVVEYRLVGSGSWTPITEFTRSGTAISPTLKYEVTGLVAGQYEIRMRHISGAYVPTIDKVVALGGKHYDTIEGKCTSRYQRTYRIPLIGTAPWDIRVSRLTPTAIDSSVQDSTYFDSITECVDVKLNYTNTAAIMLSIDAENFQSIPTRGYDIKGLRVRIPSNYDPITRAYTGSWNGTFKVDWTDNPAWCFYDMLSNARYGLGEYMDSSQIDKWGLYTIGQYCDELIPDGFGGTEPRFTCNLYLQSREDAFNVVNSMASIFRGMAFWAGGQIVATQDAPHDSAALFTSANVIEGLFTYNGADRRARHTVALVSWNDPNDMYTQKIEYVQDDEAVIRWGNIETEILAVGCTSRGQAHRVGKWLLFTEQNESETISFKAGMDAARIAPGNIITTQDPIRSGARMGGRLLSGSTVSQLTIDSPVTLGAGLTYQVSVVLGTGLIETRNVSNSAGSAATLQLATPLTSVPTQNAIWVLNASNLQAEKWRVLSVSEVDKAIVEITAMYHNPTKYAFVETGVVLEYIPTSITPTRPGQVTGIVSENQLFSLNSGVVSTRIAIDWKAPETAVTYAISWRRDSDNFKSDESETPNYSIDNVAAGTYTIRITPKNALGITGETVTFTHVVESSGIAPDILNLRANPSFSGTDLPVAWDAMPAALEYQIEVRDSSTDALLRTEKTTFTEYIYVFAKNAQDGGPRRSIKIRVRAKTLAGLSANWTEQTFTNAAPATPTGLVGEAGPGQASVMAARPTDEDLAGMIVWMHTAVAVPTTDAYKVYQGSDNAFTKTGLTPGIPMYFKMAFYDSFGVTGINVSTALSVTPTATGGVSKVTSLPANPEAVGGELALFLDVADTSVRGMYGWDGTAWVSTNVLLNGSVTTAKLAAGAVDYTKIAAGAVQARNLSVKKHFLY